MYLHEPIFFMTKRDYRHDLIETSKKIAREYQKNRLCIMADMIWSSFKYGSMFEEYREFNFQDRSAENRATFMTTFSNFRIYKKINLKPYRYLFRNKKEFLTKFSPYIHRKWLDLSTCEDQKIREFLNSKSEVVFKESTGDSGNQVAIKNLSQFHSPEELKMYAEKNHFDLVEECIKNCSAIAEFNSTSLNTLRVVTIAGKTDIHFLFAGLRVGAPGKRMDNLCQGGSVAKVNLDTGKIESLFYSKIIGNKVPVGPNAIGFQIPFWEKLKELLKETARVVPQIKFVAWDVAITENGPEIIECNESFGSGVLQLFCGVEDEGLKPLLNQYLADIDQ